MKRHPLSVTTRTTDPRAAFALVPRSVPPGTHVRFEPVGPPPGPPHKRRADAPDVDVHFDGPSSVRVTLKRGRRRGSDRPAQPIATPPPVIIVSIPRVMEEHYDGVQRVLEVLLRVPVPGWSWSIDESAEGATGLLAAARSAGDVSPRDEWTGNQHGAIRNGERVLVAVRFERLP